MKLISIPNFLPPGLQTFRLSLLVFTSCSHSKSTKLSSIRKVLDGKVRNFLPTKISSFTVPRSSAGCPRRGHRRVQACMPCRVNLRSYMMVGLLVHGYIVRKRSAAVWDSLTKFFSSATSDVWWKRIPDELPDSRFWRNFSLMKISCYSISFSPTFHWWWLVRWSFNRRGRGQSACVETFFFFDCHHLHWYHVFFFFKRLGTTLVKGSVDRSLLPSAIFLIFTRNRPWKS